jgi:hypothetical protein
LGQLTARTNLRTFGAKLRLAGRKRRLQASNGYGKQ